MIKEKEVNNLREIDLNNRFIGLSRDVIFKSVMQRNPDVLEDFLKDLLNLQIDEEESIIFLDKELIKGRIKEKGRIVDVNIKFGKDYLIQVEVNSSSYETVMERNNLYLEKLDTLRYETNNKKQKAFDTKYLYQVNLNVNEPKENKTGYQKIVDYDIVNNKIMPERVVKFVFNLDYYYDLYYNGDVKERSYSEIFLASMKSKNYTEEYTMLSNIMSEERLNKFMEDMIDMTNEDLLYHIHYWEKDKMDALVERKKKEIEERERKKQIEEGRAEGLAEGIETNTIEMIKNMLSKKIDIDIISEVSNKSVEEIKLIEESMNN